MKIYLFLIMMLIPLHQIHTWTVEVAFYDNILRVNNIEYPMVFVEGGDFYMGATDEQGEDGRLDPNERPVHQVTLTNYRIGKFEVTQELWESVMGTNPSRFKHPKNPVDQVSRNDCLRFIRRLNDITGRQFRLPTEAEWEYAARGGNNSKNYKHSGSNNLEDVAWYNKNSNSQTHQVGMKSSNELGIYDMNGNVSEWCSDFYGTYDSRSQTNPIGPSSGSSYVYRGGSYCDYELGCRVSGRCYEEIQMSLRYSNIGFRLCL